MPPDATGWVAIAAIVLSVLTFVATQVAGRRSASATYVDQLEAQVENLREELKRCSEEGALIRARLRDLETENLELMRKVLRLSDS